MIVAVHQDGSVFMGDLLEQHLVMLGAVPAVIAMADKPLWARDPVEGGDPMLDTLREDWKLIVEPELQAHGESEVAVMLRDLSRAAAQDHAVSPLAGDAAGDGMFQLLIPAAHVEPWYGALNQARLAIESVHGFAGQDPEDREFDQWPPEKQFIFWQFRVYGALQEGLLASMENRFEAEHGQDDLNP